MAGLHNAQFVYGGRFVGRAFVKFGISRRLTLSVQKAFNRHNIEHIKYGKNCARDFTVMASKNKWFKSAFSAEPKRPKIVNVLRSLSDEDSIDFSGLSDDLELENQNCSVLDKSFIAAGQVEVTHTNFKSSNWIENFAPQTKDDLAIHAKKIAELEEWFRTIKVVKSKRSSPILVISGPSGSGKTASLKVIAKQFDYAIIEWVTPTDIEHKRRGTNDENDNVTFSENKTDKFAQFLFQSSRYRSVLDPSAERLVLVEDFPHVFIKDPKSFEEVLERYSVYGRSPLIFIIADTKSRTLNIGHSVFTDSVRQRFRIDTISFNAVADTMVKKGLKRVCAIMAEPGFQQYYTEPSGETIDSIVLSSQGDLRNAVINLHFASQKNSCKLETQMYAQNAKTSTGLNNSKKSKTTKKNKFKSLGCDESVTVMHALGRVFNPKYNDDVDTNGNRLLQHTPETIAGIFTTQPSTNLNLIHCNYIGHFQSIEDAVNAADILSQTDLVLNEWRSDLLPEVAMTMAVRGIMVSNQHPVTGRWMPIKSAKYTPKETYDCAKESKTLGIVSLTSSNDFALDYRHFGKIIQSKKIE